MKRILFGLSLVLLLGSCSMSRTSTSTTLGVATSLTSVTSADLVVSSTKISYTYYPKKQDRKAGMAHVISNAVAAALKENGNADILVECQHEMVIKSKLFGKKIKSVTVTGYPATFKNFRVERNK
ncbi:MAG: hypothetical protein Q4D56_08570 [Bacteroides sp.]|nr:hypothetical protein [Bacteroides sp.]